MKRFLCSVSVAALTVVVTPAADTAPTGGQTGDLWEVTSQMTMEGMPAGMGMPAQTRRVCTAKDWTKPPVPADDRSKCEFVDFKNTPTKSTWKLKCEGMTGEGEINRTSPDAYTGWMKMMAPQGAMTMNLSGHKVGGCDAAAAKQERDAAVAHVQAQVAAGQQAAADAKKRACMGSVEALDLQSFTSMATTMCTDPSLKTSFCDNFKTHEGFKTVCVRKPQESENGLASVAAFCGVDPEAMTKRECEEAKKGEDLDLLGACCPIEAQRLAAEHCAGRTYTSMAGDKYQTFCATFARGLMDGSKEAAPSGAKKAKGKSGR